MNLEDAVQTLASPFSQQELKEAMKSLSKRYLSGSSQHTPIHRIAYLIMRLPATYAVLRKVLSMVEIPARVLDCGAGPGTSIFALEGMGVQELTLIEKDHEFIKLGQKLQPASPFQVSWKHASFLHLKEKADLILFSYSLNEIPQSELHSVITKAYHCTENFLIVIEPGTPAGFQRIHQVRSQLLELGMSIHAPCPHHLKCPLYHAKDWCHFSVRLARTSMHRILKDGVLGYEDEKYSYLIASKTPYSPSGERVIRSPIKRKGHTKVSLCSAAGLIEKTVTGKMRKSLEWGALLHDERKS